MDLTRNSYYLWLNDKNRKRQARKNLLSVRIKLVFMESAKTYEPVRIHKALQAENIRCSRQYASRMMAELKLRSVHKRAFRVTTNSAHEFPVAENILDKNFSPEAMNTVYAADITYIPTRQGWLYLAVVIDLYSRKVVGWAMEDNMRAEMVIRALTMAITRRRPGKTWLYHSDCYDKTNTFF